MYSAMSTFIDRLDSGRVGGTSVIPWSCPVPFFGDLKTARIATVGINPSNREFVDSRGFELDDSDRRLPTLKSLDCERWAEVNGSHLRDMVNACRRYFRTNPYDRWFRILEEVLKPSGATFYGAHSTACHLDLVPYATSNKWGSLPPGEQRLLLSETYDALGLLLRNSDIGVLVLNGRSVVKHFELMTGCSLEVEWRDDWSLPRGKAAAVPGYAYTGSVEVIGGVRLLEPIRVLGYNHNLQSSFGVTSDVISRIGAWVGKSAQLDTA
ncbi:hypothetical protein GCM10009744_00070 [Kribbella alba]|uniref:Uncharacterized protein n=2 Tax=Kribbella alba TaxID=190197 RepID=A0ABN2ETW1_9ACTN